MKKLVLSSLTLFSTCIAVALPVGNPSDPSLIIDGVIYQGRSCLDDCPTWCDIWNIRIGYYGDFVFDRHLQTDDHGIHKNIERTRITTNAAYIAMNFWDRFDVFGTLGGTSLSLCTNAETFFSTGDAASVSNGTFSIVTPTSFSWSIGGRAAVWQWGCTTLGLEGQYFYTNPNITVIDVEDLIQVYADGTQHMKYKEWQVGLGLSHRINVFIPYVAVKWAGSKAYLGEIRVISNPAPPPAFNFTIPDLNNRKAWGYAVGVTLAGSNKFTVTTEARFGDEKALYVNGQVRF